jgi:hypothetical protein
MHGTRCSPADPAAVHLLLGLLFPFAFPLLSVAVSVAPVPHLLFPCSSPAASPERLLNFSSAVSSAFS